MKASIEEKKEFIILLSKRVAGLFNPDILEEFKKLCNYKDGGSQNGMG